MPLQFVPTLSDEDRARADYYAVLSRLFFDAPDAALLVAIAGSGPIEGEASAPLADSWAALQAACKNADLRAVTFEYSNVFIGTGKALVTPYSTHYLSDSMKDRQLVRLRGKLRELGLARSDNAWAYEDHIAALCEVMRHLVLLGSGDAAVQQQKNFFITYIQPCYDQYLSSIEVCEATDFYKHAGRLCKAFFDIEAEALPMV